MINKKIMDIFKSLNIPCYYQQCTDKKDYYVIFKVYNEQDVEVIDNKSVATIYYITINYWYKKTCKDIEKYKLIKKEMKSNGFKFDGVTDLSGETHFGKNMDFTIKEWN